MIVTPSTAESSDWRNRSLLARREDALQRDAEIHCQVRHQVVMRLAASSDPDGLRVHLRVWGGGAVHLGLSAALEVAFESFCRLIAARCDGGRVRGRAHKTVIVDRHLGAEERVIFLSASLAQETIAQAWPLTLMDRNAALQVRQCEGRFSIATVK